MHPSDQSAFERLRGSVTLKMAVVTILALVLLIPVGMIESIMQERKRLSEEAAEDVTSTWAGAQRIVGPVLTIPIEEKIVKEGKDSTRNTLLHVLPDTMVGSGDVEPRTLNRGIYDVVVYDGTLDFAGTFDLKGALDSAQRESADWQNARVTLGISDLRGVKNEIRLNWNGEEVPVTSGNAGTDAIVSGVTARPSMAPDSSDEPIPFSVSVDVQGSEELSFAPVARTTEMRVISPWPDPGFHGAFLPDSREIEDEGFSATWKILEINRDLPAWWKGTDPAPTLEKAAFGIEFLQATGAYRQSIRSAKYAIVIIALVFLTFFLVEVMARRRIHPLQYTLVGLALCLFYVLVIAISEHMEFEVAYGLSALASTAMVSLYSLKALARGKYTLVLTALMALTYGFLFVLVQLTELSLLIGSIGLAGVLAATMYGTRNVNWYAISFRDDLESGPPTRSTE